MTNSDYLPKKLYSRGAREPYIPSTSSSLTQRGYNSTNSTERPYKLNTTNFPYSGRSDYSPLESASVL